MVYCERYFSRWFTGGGIENDVFENLILVTHNWLKLPVPLRPRKKIQVEWINGFPAAENPAAVHFKKAGYEQDGKNLVLWPSALI